MSAAVTDPAVRSPEGAPAMSAELAHRVATFLYHEARLLDANDPLGWAALFTEDGVYRIPPTDQPLAEPGRALYLVNDDHFRLTERARRLTKKDAHAEYPASRTCRMVANVVVTGIDGDELAAEANFVTYRYRYGRIDIYPGRADYVLRRHEDSFRIASKTVTLALDSLRPQGKISLIL